MAMRLVLGNSFEFDGVQTREMTVPKPISAERRAKKLDGEAGEGSSVLFEAGIENEV